jgi:hypothetical protein
VGKNSVRRSRVFDGGRIVLGVAECTSPSEVLKLGIRWSTVIRVEGVVLKEGCWMREGKKERGRE